MKLIGVIGPGEDASAEDETLAIAVGAGIAQAGWTVVTGGRAAGVMDAASRGARSAGGLVVGILPSAKPDGLSPAVDIPIVTGLGEARNGVIVLSCRALIACGMNAGTASEVALAIKAGRPVVLVRPESETAAFYRRLGSSLISFAETSQEALRQLAEHING